jgi:hypothetical protein
VPLKYSDGGEHGKRNGYASVTHSFVYGDRSRDDGVIFTVSDSALSAAIHTTGASLLELANKIIKELSP